MEFLGLSKAKIGNDTLAAFLEGKLPEQVSTLKHLNTGEYIDRAFIINERTEEEMRDYVAGLRENGLDIGDGNCEFGYRLSEVTRRSKSRSVAVFRRR